MLNSQPLLKRRLPDISVPHRVKTLRYKARRPSGVRGEFPRTAIIYSGLFSANINFIR
jgi:hypothetical protein